MTVSFVLFLLPSFALANNYFLSDRSRDYIPYDYAWNMLTALVVGSGRRWFTDGIYQALLLVCGLFLVYTGVRFIWVGVGMVTG